MRTHTGSRGVGVWLGAVSWLVQPLYIVTEIITATRVRVPYSFAGNTISDLGARSCTTVAYPFGPVPVCSPWHPLMNGSFVVFGVATMLGAVLLRHRLRPGAPTTASVLLWVIAGASSIATGLVPLDVDLGLHTLVSMPVFLAQPAALLILGLAHRHRHRVLGWLGVAAGMVSAIAAAATLAGLAGPSLGGLLERAALWPAYLWLPAIAAAVIRPAGTDTPTAP